MTTSGTVGQTVISTAKVLEHALRRAGVFASAQTPETVVIAKECLYLLLTHYANTSLNLWCIEKRIIGQEAGRREYTLPAQTNDVLNVSHSTPQVAAQDTLVGNIQTLTASSGLVRVGVRFSVLPTADYTIDVSTDGMVYSPVAKGLVTDLQGVGISYWFDLDPKVQCQYISVSSGTVQTIYGVTASAEIPVQPLNRDQYADLADKNTSAATVANYLFNKQIAPSLITWPVSNDDTRHLVVWVHRQIQDVGGLTQTLAIPQRWFEATIIQLAFRLAMELPGVDPARVKMLLDLSEKFKIEVSNEETDSSPTYVRPGIRAYTR